MKLTMSRPSMRDETNRGSSARLEPTVGDSTPEPDKPAPSSEWHATDDRGRSWRVRDIVASSSGPYATGELIGRMFSCSTPGPIPELRHAWRRFVAPGAVHRPGESTCSNEPTSDLASFQERLARTPLGDPDARGASRSPVLPPARLTWQPLEVTGGVAARTSLLLPTADVRFQTRPITVRPVEPGSVEPRPPSEAVSREVSSTLALVTVVVLSPVLLLVALAVRLTSPSPTGEASSLGGGARRMTAPSLDWFAE